MSLFSKKTPEDLVREREEAIQKIATSISHDNLLFLAELSGSQNVNKALSSSFNRAVIRKQCK